MQYTTVENTELTIPLLELVNDRSWVLAGDTATHYPCNVNDQLKLLTYDIEPNKEYKISFTILEASQSPNLSIGFDTPLQSYTTPQEVTVTLTTTEENKRITFWGSGYLVVRFLTIQKEAVEEETDSENTITWSEKYNRWISFRSYRPEKGFSMFTDLFTLKDGILYIHKEGDVRNNFYGKQFKTSIKFPISSPGIKTYQSLAIHSNILMVTTEDGIQTQLGHVSDLVEVDFTNREGVFYANFLRDKLTDIMNGDRLKGRFIVLELETVEGDKKLQLFKVVSKSIPSTINE